MAIELPDDHPLSAQADRGKMQRNTIGLSPEELKAQGNKRPSEPTLTIVSPDGEVVTMVHFNARDLINHKGWKEVRKQKTADDVVADDDAADQAGQGVESKEVHEELQGLRDMLTEAGVKVDARWGKKRLMEEIEKASRIDPVEDEQDAA